jgi:hypothetical protein
MEVKKCDGMKMKITAGNVEKRIKLYEDLAPETIKALVSALPVKGYVKRWGDEIYFETPIIVDIEENSKEYVELGDVAYWIPGRAICIFFGKTPISKGDEIRPASGVNVIGKVVGDAKELRSVKEGTQIVIDRVD